MKNNFIPLLFLGVVTGILSFVYLTIYPLLLIALFVGIVATFCRSYLRQYLLFFLAVVFVFYCVLSINKPPKREMLSSYAYLALSVKGQVTYSSTNKRDSLLIIEAESAQIINLGEVQVEGSFFLFSERTNLYPLGAGLQVVGSLSDFQGKTGNPINSVKTAMYHPNSVKLIRSPSKLSQFLVVIRQQIKKTFNLAGPRAGAFLAAILLGDKKILSRKLQEKLRVVGIAHLFVVSGFHVAIISFVIYKLLFLLGLSRQKAGYLLFIFLPLYGLLCGFSLSISRAIMVIFYYLIAENGQRRGSVWQALLVAGLITLFVEPASLFNPGFLLSYGATAGILFFYQDLFRRLRGLKLPAFIASPLAVSLSAQLAIIPILLLFFGRVNLLSPVVNLFILPLFLGLLLLIMFFVVLSLFFNLAAILFIVNAAVDVFFSIVDFWVGLSFSQWEYNSITPLLVLLYYLFIVVLIKGGKIFDRITSNRRNTISQEIAAVFTEKRSST